MKKISALAAAAALIFSGCMKLFDDDNVPASFTVESYKQNIADSGYVLWQEESSVQRGLAGKSTSVEAKAIPGFTARPVSQEKIRTDGSATVKIYYDRNTVTLSFDAAGGSEVAPVSGKYEAPVPAIPSPAKTGSAFTGWSPAPPVKFPAQDASFTATWDANAYTVEFNANGGSGSMAAQTFSYGSAQTLTPNAFTKSGFIFAGWNAKADGSGESYSDGQSVSNLTATPNGTVTLYAQWAEHVYAVKFEANGGTGTMPAETFIFDTAQPLTPNAFARSGFTFARWNTKADGSGASYADGQSVLNLTATPNDTVTLYAQWNDIPPSAVTDLKAVPDDGLVRLSWKNPPEADFEKAVISYESVEIPVLGTPSSPAAHAVTGLTNGTVYTFTIKAYDKGGNASASVTITMRAGGNGWLEGAPTQTQGDKLSEKSVGGITIPEVVVVPKGATAVIQMQDDSSWNGFLPDPQPAEEQGAFPKGRKVKLSPFIMGQTEVTQELYQQVIGSNPSHYGPHYPTIGAQWKTHPVELLNWYAMVVFCNELTKKTNNNSTDECVYYSDSLKTAVYTQTDANSKNPVYVDWTKKGYRLPTETEWEYAARGGNPNAPAWKYSYPGSNTAIPSASFNGTGNDPALDNFAWYNPNSMTRTHQAGSKNANTLGIYDMSGNVWEACWDWYGSMTANDSKYKDGDGYVVNPLGSDSGTTKVLRGGGYYTNYDYCIVTSRNPLVLTDNTKNHGNNFGFRVCRSQ